VDVDDKIKFNSDEFSLFVTSEEKQHCIKRRFHNKTDDVQQFYSQLRNFQFNNPQLVRPSFDTYFMRLADIAASRSNCMKAGIGAVIAKDNRVITTGYNGTPGGLPNCNAGGCARCNGNP
jgi:dCMP deaminase